MNVETLLDSVRADLAAQATPQFRASILRFFREPVDPYGVRTPAVRKIAAAAFREFREWPLAQRNRFCNELWKSGKVEEGAIVVLLYSRFRKQCAVCEFRLFEKWLDRYVANWAHCDAVSCMLLAAALENEPSLSQSLPPWTASPNRWKRRAAAVSLVPGARKGRNIEIVLDIAGRLLGDTDDMVQKGTGWLLKDAYPAKPREVVKFLQGCGTPPRLMLRIAAEKMTAQHRAIILGTRH